MALDSSGSLSPMAGVASNSNHHDQLGGAMSQHHYHQYPYDTTREAAAQASSSRNLLPLPNQQQQSPTLRQLHSNSRPWPANQPHQLAAIASSSALHVNAKSSISLASSSTTSPRYGDTNSTSSSNPSNPSISSPSIQSITTPSPLLAPPLLSNTSMPTTAASLMREGPRDFTVIKDVGDGSFGTVCLADWRSPLPSGTLLSPMQHPTTRPEYLGKRLVAIKKMKKPLPNWEECMKLKELKCLLAIPHHPNIIPLYDAFLMPVSKELHFVFECMEGNLYQLTKSRRGRPLAAGLVASIFQQIVRGLHHIHQQGYFHRDMKPENLLITTTGLADYPPTTTATLGSGAGAAPEKDVLVIVKLADFGLARETDSKPPYTEYVSTRWYRAPEVLLRSREYSNPVDMWALGTILAELVNLKPLFPGQSEVEQVMHICEVLGDPSSSYGTDERGRLKGGGEWSQGIRMAKSVGFTFPIAQPLSFSSLFSSKVPPSLVDCIQDLLRYDPKARLTTTDCMQHTYYQKVAPRLQPPQSKAIVSATTSEEREKIAAKTTASMIPMGSIMDQRAQRSAMPGSHSMTSQANKPSFGEVRQQNKDEDTDVPMEAVSSGMDQTRMTRWAPAPAGPIGESSISQYPTFPDSASLFADRNSTHYEEVGHDSHRPEGQYSTGTIRHNEQSVYQQREQDEDLEMQHQQQEYDDYGRRAGGMQQTAGYPALNYDHGHLMYRHGHPNLPDVSSTNVDIEGRDVTNTSNDTTAVKERDQRKSKGWISSVLHGGGGAASASMGQSSNQSRQQPLAPLASSGLTASPSTTPAQQLAAEHSERSSAQKAAEPPLDPKKAKKLAEKMAREAEKAKRATQEKLARERARAVMQKRNQILASSNSRDQVEWLTLADNDKSKALQPPISLNPAPPLLPSETSRGKQPSMGSMQASTSDSSNLYAITSSYPSQSNSLNSPAWQSQRSSSRGKIRMREFDDDGASRSYFAGGGGPYSVQDARRQSIQSFQTGDSDPGPNRTMAPGAGLPMMQHHESSSSLNSAPGHLDAGSSSRNRYGDRYSFDNRSVASSLDHQLIQNMENMSAAEGGANLRQQTGSTSPGPIHLVGQRPSYSRQSHGSRTSSAHRQGSASPLHHQAPPRFHPYTVGSGVINGNVPPSSSAHSSYSFNLPSLASITQNSANVDYVENLQSGSGGGGTGTGLGTRPRSMPRRSSQSAHRGPASRGSLASGDGPLPRQHPTSGGNFAGPIHPMFHVSSSHLKSPQPQTPPPLGPSPTQLLKGSGSGLSSPLQQQHTLPPFSHLAAAASSHRGDDLYTTQSSPLHRSDSNSHHR